MPENFTVIHAGRCTSDCSHYNLRKPQQNSTTVIIIVFKTILFEVNGNYTRMGEKGEGEGHRGDKSERTERFTLEQSAKRSSLVT